MSIYNLTLLSITKCRAFYRNLYNYIVLLLFFFSYSVHSATEHQLQLIQQTAENYILKTVKPQKGSKISAHASKPDARLQLSDCPTGLTASSSSTNALSSNIPVLIQCKAENWRLYVPVRLTITVPAVTAAQALSRGQVISKNDVTINMVDMLHFRQQGFSQISQVVGAKMKRNVTIGNIISNHDICVVCRNENVIIKAHKNTMSITTQGTALSDGGLGEQIRVKNNRTNRIIDAQVTGIGEVSVTF